MSRAYENAFEFLNSQQADELIQHDFEDHKRALEMEFNEHIDECVQADIYSYEEGENYKLVHHRTLWGLPIE